MSKIIPLLETPVKLRPIRLKWTCSITGDCCKVVNTVLMSPAEQAEIVAYVSPDLAATLRWASDESGRFVRLQAHPCPLLRADNRCGVYPVRPYNCRRWGCMRADVTKEPLEPDHSFLGCANARERFHQNRGIRRQLAHMQTKAQRWALRHGWTPDDSTPEGGLGGV